MKPPAAVVCSTSNRSLMPNGERRLGPPPQSPLQGPLLLLGRCAGCSAGCFVAAVRLVVSDLGRRS